MAPNVLVVTNMYPGFDHPYYGVFVRDHVQALRARGHRVDVFFTDGSTRRSAYPGDIPRLVRQVRRGGYDLIHTHHTYSTYQAETARRIARRRLPLVFTIHEGELHRDHHVRDDGADALTRLRYSARLKRRALRMADRVVAVERRLPGLAGFDGPFDVIPPGVDLDLFHPMPMDRCRLHLALPTGDPIVFFPASPSRGTLKGVDLLREGLSRLDRPIRLLTAGDIPHEHMPLYLNAADLVVLTSRFEASPMAVKEAMACDRPMVCTDVGDAAETFGTTPGYRLCGLDPDDVARAIGEALADQTRPRGRARLDELRLSLDEVARRYEEVYALCLPEARAEPALQDVETRLVSVGGRER